VGSTRRNSEPAAETQPAGQHDTLLAPLGRQAVSHSRMVASTARGNPPQLAGIIRRMQEEDIQALRAAVATLEHPGFAARLAEIAGKPIELFNRALPERRCDGVGYRPARTFVNRPAGHDTGAGNLRRRFVPRPAIN
jgi:hypothetical protein